MVSLNLISRSQTKSGVDKCEVVFKGLIATTIKSELGYMYAQEKKSVQHSFSSNRQGTHAGAQKKTNVEQGLSFVDNRPEHVGRKPLQKQSTSGMKLVQLQSSVIQLHKGNDETDETLDDMIIYKVVRKSDGSVVYVGQTEDAVGIDSRFDQHLLTHTWSKSTHKIARIEAGSWTRFETDCAEQYWIDHFGGKDSLENEKNQVSRSRFERVCQYQTDNGLTLFRGTAIGFPAGWKPVN